MSDHPYIADAERYIPDPGSIEETARRTALSLTLLSPDARIDVIREVEAQVAEGGATLRQKAQLLNLRRELTQTHEKLLLAGR